ncbi:MAG: S8 family serine peptidase [Phycisphaerales bacterium]|nr:S8 family serine peptidase [Phycisphaerales bacterium]
MHQPRPLSVAPSALRLLALAGVACSALAAPVDLTPNLNALRAFEDVAGPAGPADATALFLRAGVVQTDISPARLSSLLMLEPERDQSAGRMVIQLDGPMTAERRAALENAGVSIGDYLPVNAFIVTLNPRAGAGALDALHFVRFASPFQASWKIDPEIGTFPMHKPERVAIAAEGKVLVTAYLFNGEAAGPALDAIRAIDGVQAEAIGELGGNETISVVAPMGAIQQIAEIGAVQFIEEAPEVFERNNTVRAIVQSGTTTLTPLYNNGLTGVGQIVGHIDSAIQRLHCSFADATVGNVPGPAHRKILAYNQAFGAASHGSHTAGTIAGDGGSFSDTRGVAYDAKIVHHGIPSDSSTGTTFKSRLDLHHSQGARVHTNSWGADGTTQYNGWTRATDLFSREKEDSMVAFAITNQSQLFTPENAKNGLAVGASQDNANINSFCSGGTGPTSDGRFKPEIYSPGCSITSATTSTSCTVTSSTGTSMACPSVTGTASLVRQYYTDGYYPTGVAGANPSINPSGALIRATILNAGQDMTAVSAASTIGGAGTVAYPNNREGWGRLVADASLAFPSDARRMVVRDFWSGQAGSPAAGSLTTGQVYELEFDVNSSAQQLRVTMTFTDLAASIGASFAPINNIDLEVVTPSGAVYLGNRFTGGVSITGGPADAINSTEQVHLNNPEVGTWKARVKGTAVNQQTQGFALVITGDVDDQITVPCPGDFDGDLAVGFSDLNILLGNYNQTGANLPGDLDMDGDVDFADLNAFLALYNLPCGGAARAARVSTVNGLDRLGH